MMIRVILTKRDVLFPLIPGRRVLVGISHPRTPPITSFVLVFHTDQKVRPLFSRNPIPTYRMFSVTDDEAASNTTSASLERGLAFGWLKCITSPNEFRLTEVAIVAYQSNINKGFRFLQQFWVNNAK